MPGRGLRDRRGVRGEVRLALTGRPAGDAAGRRVVVSSMICHARWRIPSTPVAPEQVLVSVSDVPVKSGPLDSDGTRAPWRNHGRLR